MQHPKYKADELFGKYLPLVDCGNNIHTTKVQKENAKQCALIAVKEVISQWEYIHTHIADLGGKLNPNLKYWNEVENELEAM